jgi:1-acyl-sn-glycerol-3-phosphate acyltransferase
LSVIRLYFKAFLAGLTIAAYIPFLYMSDIKNKTRRTVMARILMRIFMVKPDVSGSMDDSATMFVINHQSVLDIVAMEATTTRNLAWIAKRELFEIPLFGHLFKSCKMISVDRDNKQGLLKLLKDSKERLENNRPLVIFPEGTRGKGKELLEFKAGAKLIADKLGLKVQPIVIVDSANFFDTKHSFKDGGGASKGGVLKIIYLDSFVPEGKEWLEEARQKMQKALDEARA